MTDLHTHILPGMDDGARDADESIILLQQEQTQGVDTVVLTPHFYPGQEIPERFLKRRTESFEKLNARMRELPPEEQQRLPRLVLGAEVAWNHALLDCDKIGELCIGQTRNLLIEMPFTPWSDHTINLIYNLMGCADIVPVIAHLERYLSDQSAGRIREILEMGVPIQVSADIFRYPLVRGKVIKMLRRGQVHVLGSDCHSTGDRPPNMKAAMDVICKKLGTRLAEEVIRCGDSLVEQ